MSESDSEVEIPSQEEEEDFTSLSEQSDSPPPPTYMKKDKKKRKPVEKKEKKKFEKKTPEKKKNVLEEYYHDIKKKSTKTEKEKEFVEKYENKESLERMKKENMKQLTSLMKKLSSGEKEKEKKRSIPIMAQEFDVPDVLLEARSKFKNDTEFQDLFESLYDKKLNEGKMTAHKLSDLINGYQKDKTADVTSIYSKLNPIGFIFYAYLRQLESGKLGDKLKPKKDLLDMLHNKDPIPYRKIMGLTCAFMKYYQN